MNNPYDPHELASLLSEMTRQWRLRLNERLAPLNLSQPRWWIIRTLRDAGAGMVQKDIAAQMGVEGPSVARMIDRMEEDGWLERRTAEGDRRCKRVCLTEQTRNLISEIEAISLQLQHELTHDIPVSDIQQCMQTLSRILERARELQPGGQGDSSVQGDR
ncbi:MAG: MarR family transcriptional regulator [Gammaproteobacteria bacterium]|jgi:MarR family transcriptional regulator for hemolysin